MSAKVGRGVVFIDWLRLSFRLVEVLLLHSQKCVLVKKRNDFAVAAGFGVFEGCASVDPLVACPTANELFVGSIAESVAFCCPSASRITNPDRNRNR